MKIRLEEIDVIIVILRAEVHDLVTATAFSLIHIQQEPVAAFTSPEIIDRIIIKHITAGTIRLEEVTAVEAASGRAHDIAAALSERATAAVP